MAQVGAQMLTKGPLSTAIGQYIFLGFGTFALFTGDNGVSRAAQEVANVIFRLATGRDSLPSSAALLREAGLVASLRNNKDVNGGGQSQQPIVIHSHAAPNLRNGSWTAIIIQVGVGAGACWTAYFLFSNFLPEQLKELMPVTRKFFQTAVTSLGNGIIKVRDALSEQIAVISGKQDELSAKQDETQGTVLGIKNDIGDVRLHIDDIATAISRCEGSLTDAAGRQTFMSQGVRLLVQCVGDLLRPSNPNIAEELDQFSRLSCELMESDDFYYKKDKNGQLPSRERQQLESEYPSSPNLSEIGSVSSHQQAQHIRPLSLPRHRMSQSQSIVTPRDPYNAPASTSKIMGSARKMLHSFNNSSSCGDTITTAASSSRSFMRSMTSPLEAEIPLSNYLDSYSSGNITPSSDVTDPVKLDDVDELLRVVRSGVVPAGV